MSKNSSNQNTPSRKSTSIRVGSENSQKPKPITALDLMEVKDSDFSVKKESVNESNNAKKGDQKQPAQNNPETQSEDIKRANDIRQIRGSLKKRNTEDFDVDEYYKNIIRDNGKFKEEFVEILTQLIEENFSQQPCNYRKKGETYHQGAQKVDKSQEKKDNIFIFYESKSALNNKISLILKKDNFSQDDKYELESFFKEKIKAKHLYYTDSANRLLADLYVNILKNIANNSSQSSRKFAPREVYPQLENKKGELILKGGKPVENGTQQTVEQTDVDLYYTIKAINDFTNDKTLDQLIDNRLNLINRLDTKQVIDFESLNYAEQHPAIYPRESTILTKNQAHEVLAKKLEQGDEEVANSNIRKEVAAILLGTGAKKVNNHDQIESIIFDTKFENTKDLREALAKEGHAPKLEAGSNQAQQINYDKYNRLLSDLTLSSEQNIAFTQIEEMFDEIASSDQNGIKLRRKPLIFLGTGEGKSFLIQNVLAKYSELVNKFNVDTTIQGKISEILSSKVELSDADIIKEFLQKLNSFNKAGTKIDGIDIGNITNSQEELEDFAKNPDKLLKQYQLFQNKFEIKEINLANKDELKKYANFDSANANNEETLDPKNKVIIIDEVFYIENSSELMSKITANGGKVIRVGASANTFKALEDTHHKTDKDFLSRKIKILENEKEAIENYLRPKEGQKAGEQVVEQIDEQPYEQPYYEGLEKRLKEIDETIKNLTNPKNYSDNLKQDQSFNSFDNSFFQGDISDPSELTKYQTAKKLKEIAETNLKKIAERREEAKQILLRDKTSIINNEKISDNWQELISEEQKSKRVQYLFPGTKINFPADKNALIEAAKKNPDHSIVANYIENDKHRVAYIKPGGEEVFYFDSGSPGFQKAIKDENGNVYTKAIMIYAGDLEYVVGGDYSKLSHLAQGDKQKIFLKNPSLTSEKKGSEQSSDKASDSDKDSEKLLEKLYNANLLYQMFGRNRGPKTEHIITKVYIEDTSSEHKALTNDQKKQYANIFIKNALKSDLETHVEHLSKKVERHEKELLETTNKLISPILRSPRSSRPSSPEEESNPKILYQGSGQSLQFYSFYQTNNSHDTVKEYQPNILLSEKNQKTQEKQLSKSLSFGDQYLANSSFDEVNTIHAIIPSSSQTSDYEIKSIILVGGFVYYNNNPKYFKVITEEEIYNIHLSNLDSLVHLVEDNDEQYTCDYSAITYDLDLISGFQFINNAIALQNSSEIGYQVPDAKLLYKYNRDLKSLIFYEGLSKGEILIPNVEKILQNPQDYNISDADLKILQQAREDNDYKISLKEKPIGEENDSKIYIADIDKIEALARIVHAKENVFCKIKKAVDKKGQELVAKRKQEKAREEALKTLNENISKIIEVFENFAKALEDENTQNPYREQDKKNEISAKIEEYRNLVNEIKEQRKKFLKDTEVHDQDMKELSNRTNEVIEKGKEVEELTNSVKERINLFKNNNTAGKASSSDSFDKYEVQTLAANSTIQRANEENIKLQQQIASLNIKITELQSETNSFSSKNIALLKRNQALQNYVDELNQSILRLFGFSSEGQDIKDRLSLLNEELKLKKAIEKENTKLKSEIEGLKAEVQKRDEELRQKNEELKAEKAKNNDLEKSLAELVAQKKGLDYQINQLNAALKKAAEDKASLEQQFVNDKAALDSQLKTATQGNTKLLTEKSALESQIAGNQTAINDLNNQITQKDNEIAQINNEKDASDQEIARLNASLQSKTNSEAQLNAELTAQKQGLENQINQLNANLQKVEGEKTDLQQQLQVSSANQANLETQLRTANQGNSQLLKEKLALKSQIAENQKTIIDLTSQITQKDAEIAKINNEKNTSDQETVELKQSLQTLKQAKTNAETQLNVELAAKQTIKANLVSSGAENQNLNAQITQLTADLAAQKQEFYDQINQLESSSLKELTGQSQKYSQQIDNLAEKLQNNDARKAQLESQIKQNKNDIIDLKDQITSKDNEIDQNAYAKKESDKKIKELEELLTKSEDDRRVVEYNLGKANEQLKAAEENIKKNKNLSEDEEKSLKKKIQELNSDVQALEKEKRDNLNRIKSLQDELQKNQNENASLQRELKGLFNEKSDLSNQLKGANEENEKLKIELEASNQVKLAQDSAFTVLNQSLLSANQDNQSKYNEIERLKAESDKNKAKLSRATEDLKKSQDELLIVKENIVKRENKLLEVQQKLRQSELDLNQSNNSNSTNSALQNELIASHNSHLRTLGRTILDLEAQREKLQHRNNELEKEVRKITEENKNLIGHINPLQGSNSTIINSDNERQVFNNETELLLSFDSDAENEKSSIINKLQAKLQQIDKNNREDSGESWFNSKKVRQFLYKIKEELQNEADIEKFIKNLNNLANAGYKRELVPYNLDSTDITVINKFDDISKNSPIKDPSRAVLKEFLAGFVRDKTAIFNQEFNTQMFLRSTGRGSDGSRTNVNLQDMGFSNLDNRDLRKLFFSALGKPNHITNNPDATRLIDGKDKGGNYKG